MMRVLAIYSIAIALFVTVALLVEGRGLMEPRSVYTYEETVVAVVLAVIFIIPVLVFSAMYRIHDIKR